MVSARRTRRTLVLFATLALLSCAAAGGLRPAAALFHVNGCSSSPDLDIRVCCDLHDVGYRIGGTEADRLRLDQEFRTCIDGHGYDVLDAVYYRAVRWFGGPHFHYLEEP